MNDPTFCDGFGNIAFVGSMVRMEIVVLSPTKKNKDGRVEREHLGQVVMPPEAFLQGFAAMQNLVKQLKDKGIIQERPAAAGKDAAKATSPAGRA